MPNIREQRLTQDELYILASNGQSITLTRADIIAHYQTETGSATTRRLNTIAWIKNQIVAALGADMISVEDIDFDMDGSQRLNKLEAWSGRTV